MGWVPVFLAAFIALAACGEASAPGSPAEADIRKAILHFYASTTAGPLSGTDPNNMRHAAIVSTGRCKVLDADFICPVVFDRPGEGRAQRYVWMTKSTEDWEMVVITSEPPDSVL